ncbi:MULTISPECIES: hypothetical protein [Gordonia]|uniref:hypothetical protein n=1 Tax=Gordonia TaxID=2053 RepID=UPI000349FD79|nr:MULTISPECIES: hypothetical protein [Gordonia]AUH68795.1 hypothetical protein CXX93_11015 [Gordonia sp. YC-JH1]KXT58092.1 hypothetical protein Y710_05820 [Gordonia sp. QH-12]MBY4571398.1 hypothetical protein [Gordonia sihwensis]
MSSDDSKDISDARPDDADADDTAVAMDASESGNAAKRAERKAGREKADSVSVTISMRRVKQAIVGLLVVAVIAVIAVGGWQLYEKDQKLAAFDDSKAAASNFVGTYFQAMSGPNADAKSLRDAVGPLSTGEFKKRLDSDAVVSTEFMKENKVENIKTTVTSSMVESFSADQATVVLGVDVTGTSAISTTGGKNAILLQLNMKKVDGDWLVSAIEAGPGVTVGSQQAQQQIPTPAPTQTPAPVPGG